MDNLTYVTEDKFLNKLLSLENNSWFQATKRYKFKRVDTFFVIEYDNTEVQVKDYDSLKDFISELDDLRICSVCGMPMQEGFTDEEDYWCTEEEFIEAMNNAYGIGNWRAEPTKTKEWNYEYRISSNDSWLPECSYWTEWY